MSLTTLTAVANVALAKIGQDPISNIESDSSPERVINLVTKDVVRRVQAEFCWPELIVYKEDLSVLAELTHDQLFQYTLPADVYFPFEVVADVDEQTIGQTFEIRGEYLVSALQYANLVYYKQSNVVTEWSVFLQQTVEFELAADLAVSLLKDANLHGYLKQIAKTEGATMKRRATAAGKSGHSLPRGYDHYQSRFYGMQTKFANANFEVGKNR